MVAVATKIILASDRNMQNIVQVCLQKLGGWEAIAASSASESSIEAEFRTTRCYLARSNDVRSQH